MGKKRLPLVHDRDCPYCGSGKTVLSAHNTRYDDNTVLKCKDCGQFFRTMQRFERRPDWPTLTVFGAVIRFNHNLLDLLDLRDGDEVNFTLSDRIAVAKGPGHILRLKDKNIGRTLVLTDHNIAWAIRFECGDLQTKTLSIYINDNYKIMGIIRKSTIGKNHTYEKSEYERKCFLGIRPNGTSALSSLLISVLKAEKGDTLMLYEHNKEYYIYLTTNQEERNDGFRITTAGYSGFSGGLTIGSNKLALFLCDLYNIKTGEPFRVRISEDRQDIAGRSMFRIVGLMD